MKLSTSWLPLHRWIGLAFGLFGIMWFASVIPMSLFPYGDRPTPPMLLRGYGPPLTPADLETVPAVPDRGPGGEAIQAASLHRLDRDLVWQLDLGRRGTRVVRAATGDERKVMSRDEAGHIASLVLGDGAKPREIGQLGGLDLFYSTARTNEIPLYRVSFDDANATEVYLHPVTGEVQRVLGTKERLYRLGRMPHLLRFPPFDVREGLAAWVRFVGLLGLMLATIAGFTYGMWLTFGQRRRSGRVLAAAHLWLGIVLFPVILLWGASGFVMLFSDATIAPTAKETAPLRGKPLRAAEFLISPDNALRAASAASPQPVMALQASRFLDRPVYLALHADGHATMVDGASGRVSSPLPDEAVGTVAQRFAGMHAAVTAIDRIDVYDIYYYKLKRSDPLPLPVYRVRMTSRDGSDIPTTVYVDAYSGDVRGRVDRAYKFDRWLARLPHTFDLPWMLAHPAVRASIVAGIGTFATILALSGIWMGVSHFLRLAARRRRAGVPAMAVAAEN